MHQRFVTPYLSGCYLPRGELKREVSTPSLLGGEGLPPTCILPRKGGGGGKREVELFYGDAHERPTPGAILPWHDGAKISSANFAELLLREEGLLCYCLQSIFLC
jgi:hypothetical protein